MAKRGPKPKKRLAVDREPIHERELSLREEDELDEFVYQPHEQYDPLHIPIEIRRKILDVYGFVLQWVVVDVLGQRQESFITTRKKNRFEFVNKGNFGGLLDSYCDRSGLAQRGGQALMARRVEYDEKARAHELLIAKRAVLDMREKHSEEGVDVSMPGGGRHQSALRQNRHRTDVESYQVPED